MPKCDCCGRTFEPGENEFGVPNGVGFSSYFGYITAICSDCIVNRNDRAMRIVELDKFKKPEE